jgi:hypothetical protein
VKLFLQIILTTVIQLITKTFAAKQKSTSNLSSIKEKVIKILLILLKLKLTKPINNYQKN